MAVFFSMLSPSAIFEQIPFARKTIKELVELGNFPPGVKIYPEQHRAAMGNIFPEILGNGRLYRSMLMLVEKDNLPNSVDFVLPEESGMPDLKPIKRSRGAMVTFERKCSDTISDLIFTIYVDKQYCPDAVPHGYETNLLIKRSETVAMEFLCALAAFKELRDELPRGIIPSVVPVEHPEFDEAFNLLCPDDEILATAIKFYKKNKAPLLDVLDFFRSDSAPSNSASDMPDFWDHWQYVRRVRAHLVAKRIREIYLEISKHPKYLTPKRPLSEKARSLFECPS